MGRMCTYKYTYTCMGVYVYTCNSPCHVALRLDRQHSCSERKHVSRKPPVVGSQVESWASASVAPNHEGGDHLLDVIFWLEV